jgi:phage-related baseplate assembly protein
MSPLPQSMDYTARDFDALRQRLIALIRSAFPDWSDFDVASFGNILLEMFAFVGDVLGFYIDNQGREARLATATQRKNVIALAHMLGYRLRGAAAARAQVWFSLPQPATADVKIPAGTRVRTQEVVDSVRFALLHDVWIRAGQREAAGEVEHATAHVQRFDVGGAPDTILTLAHTPYLDGSAQLRAGNGAFVEVERLLSSGPTDRHFTVSVDQDDRARLRFGTGLQGLAPTGTVTVTYRTGGGPTGNVDAGRLVVAEGLFQDAFGKPAQVRVTNPEAARGGAARESIQQARQQIPAQLRATSRSVTREDFEIHARQVPGVARALMLTSDQDRTIPENTGVLWIIPDGGGEPSPALKQQVLRQVTEVYPCTLTFQVDVRGARYKPVDVVAQVFVSSTADPWTVRERVRARLQALFAPDSAAMGFGFQIQEVAWSKVADVIHDTPGVRKLGAAQVRLNGQPQDVALQVFEFPVLGQVVLLDGDHGGIL